MKYLLIILFVFSSFGLFAQHRNDVWCFGDSAGIDFSNLNNPIPIHSAVKSRGSCVSICDSNSGLLFSAYTRATIIGNTTLVKNADDSLMLNGDSIVGRGWYMELIIIPFPDDSTKFYLFSGGVTTLFGLYYSIVDMTLDSGRGSVIQKNVPLLFDPANDGLTAVKHGNGRDWWLLFRNDGYYAGGPNNQFYKFLITPAGITQVASQNIGDSLNSGFQKLPFNKTGNKLALAAYEGLIEIFDFDRCTGMLSNHVRIRPNNTTAPVPEFVGCEFSPDSRYLYVTTNGYSDSTRLIQIDLQDTALYNSADTLYSDGSIISSGGFLRRAPDDKIYFARMWNDGSFGYPYDDTLFNQCNTYLSVINQPDSPGVTCNFTPFSFYLGGNRTYWGLPNNPDYDLPPLYGSICDSLSTGIPIIEQGIIKSQLHLTYISEWDKLFINAEHLKGTTYKLTVIDITGRLMVNEKGRLRPPYFTKDLDCNGFSKGMYIVTLTTNKEQVTRRFIKN